MVHDKREAYESVGFSTIPLLTDGKKTDLEAWSTRPSADLWQEVEAHADRYANIGIRAGNGVAMLDADNETTVTAIMRHLDGLGFGLGQFPLVRTWSDKRHFYVDLAGDAYGSYVQLGDGLSGEFRFGTGAYCVAPQSAIDGRQYVLIAGNWSQRPILTWSDFAPLVKYKKADLVGGVASLPVPLLWRELPRRGWVLLNWLKTAQKGASFEQYKTRSEVEFSVLLSMARNGRSYSDAVGLFEKRQPAHYKESKAKHAYLSRSWSNAVNLIAVTEPRPAIAELYHQADRWQWKYDTDRRVFLGVLSLAYEAATWQPAAAQRDLMLLSGMKRRQTVGRSLERLQEAGFLRRVDSGQNTKAAVYRVLGQDRTIRHIGEGTTTLSYGTVLSTENASLPDSGFTCPQSKVKPLSEQAVAVELENALWSWLGGSCKPVYAVVCGGDGVTPVEVAEAIEKSTRTGKRTLGRLQEHGLVAVGLDGRWHKTSVTVADLVKRYDIADDVEKQRKRIDVERRQYRKVLEYLAERAEGGDA